MSKIIIYLVKKLCEKIILINYEDIYEKKPHPLRKLAMQTLEKEKGHLITFIFLVVHIVY